MVRRARKAGAGLLVAAAILMVTTAPASAAPTVFGLYPPYYCADVNALSNQFQDAQGNDLNAFDVYGITRSLNSQGTGHCNQDTNAFAGFIAVLPDLQVWYGAWVDCIPGVHRVNNTVNWYVESEVPYATGCGAASTYRSKAEGRVTRPDGPHYATDYGYNVI